MGWHEPGLGAGRNGAQRVKVCGERGRAAGPGLGWGVWHAHWVDGVTDCDGAGGLPDAVTEGLHTQRKWEGCETHSAHGCGWWIHKGELDSTPTPPQILAPTKAPWHQRFRLVSGTLPFSRRTDRTRLCRPAHSTAGASRVAPVATGATGGGGGTGTGGRHRLGARQRQWRGWS
eukprot:scaffold10853_cov101-Isochrysis_galbana.AAC.2